MVSFKRSCQNWFQCVKKTPLSEFLLLKFFLKFFSSDSKQKFFWNSLNSFSWQKWLLGVCKIFLMTQFFWHEIESKFQSWFHQKFIDLFSIFSNMIFKVAFQVSRRTIRGWNFLKLLSFRIDFQNWAKRFWSLGPKFERYCQCCIINSMRNFLMIMFFKELLIFFAFPVFDWNFFWLSTVIFRQGCQNCTLHFWMKTLRSEFFSSKKIFLLIFYYFDQINSQIFVINFGPGCQNCFQSVEKAALNFFLDFFSIICVILIGLSYDTCRKRERLSKLLYYCLDKFFWSKLLFLI